MKKSITVNSKKIIGRPPQYFILCLLVTLLLGIFFRPFGYIPISLALAFGVPLVLTGVCLILDVHFQLQRNNTPEDFQKSLHLVKKRTYTFSRNPMYLGFVILLLGVAALSGNILSFVSPVLFFAVTNWMFIPYEEEKMADEIGTAYLDYRNEVRRWI